MEEMLKAKPNGTRILPDRLRIPFIPSEGKAYEDRKYFQLWREGKITTERGAFLVGVNNKCVVTSEQFVANAEWLGFRDIFKEEDKKR